LQRGVPIWEINSELGSTLKYPTLKYTLPTVA